MGEAMTTHEHFEELCSLAALGQVTGPEFDELREHMRFCATCRAAYRDFTRILETELPLANPRAISTSKWAALLARSSARKLRFVERAKALGFQFADEKPARPAFWPRLAHLFASSMSYRFASAMVILALASMVGILGYRWKEEKLHNAAATAEVARIGGENAALRQQVGELAQDKGLAEANLPPARSEPPSLARRVQELQDQLRQATLVLEDAKAELGDARATGSRTETKLRDAEQAIGQMTNEVQALREIRTRDDSLLATQKEQIAELSRRLDEQTAMLDRERRLLAADRDIRELMGARSLHIVDVADFDGRGKHRRAFGRVFYTENKSLIFYAFDLVDPKAAEAKYSFQAWGERQGAGPAPVSLGILYVDDAAQKRWVLKFDDAEVLRQIDTLFVTVEPHGGGERPTGQKLLYAYLGKQANHP